MNLLNSTIDFVQSTKKQFVNTFITDKPTSDALNKFVDQQTEYTKSMSKTMLETITVLGERTNVYVSDFYKSSSVVPNFTDFLSKFATKK